ncbi:MAG: lysozyme [Calditrichia bacterium]
MFKISGRGIEKIKEHESLRLQAYPDQAGKMTIGYGHLIKPNEQFLLDPRGITEQIADDLLKKDLSFAEKGVNKNVSVPLSGNQYDALVSFVYNIGVNAFRRSTLLKKLNDGDYSGAANEFKRWRLAGGKVSKGLIARRQREETLFRTA